MNTSDNRFGAQPDQPDAAPPGADFQHLKDDVTEALGGARQQADAQFGQYRDTAADQIEALAKGAKSAISELDSQATFGMSDYLADMADSMTGLAGNLRGKSAEQLFHDGADLARSNPTLFIAGSIALGFGLSRFLKAGSARAATYSQAEDPAAGRSTPPANGYGAQRPFETSVAGHADRGPGLATDSTPAAPSEFDHPSDFASTPTPASTTPGSNPFNGERP
ncbi:hypothetical protein RG836_00640 [Pseudomonas sp. SZMC_28357]|uniref:hypothetical protein n=1 Tax=Pseudomonas sp. SZMC_28357 TaxID=3074380 RepID=UPI0028715FCB|nr:hypothetical protein [Pseudomonas sp. SZMC_28357]MDR9749941.1 hypothetical protein [Pseudomonas sp. SZMC_28357]